MTLLTRYPWLGSTYNGSIYNHYWIIIILLNITNGFFFAGPAFPLIRRLWDRSACLACACKGSALSCFPKWTRRPCLEEKPLFQISQKKGARVGSMHGLDKFCCRSFGSRVWEDKIFCTNGIEVASFWMCTPDTTPLPFVPEIFTFPFGLAWSLTIASVYWRLASNDGGVEDPGIMQSAPKCALLWNRSLYFPSPIPPMASEILFPLWRGGGGVLKALDNEAPGMMLFALPDLFSGLDWFSRGMSIRFPLPILSRSLFCLLAALGTTSLSPALSDMPFSI